MSRGVQPDEHMKMLVRGEAPVHGFQPPDPDAWPDGWLVRQHSIHVCHEGFNATVGALKDTVDAINGMDERRTPASRVNISNGAGALVRVASAGVLFGPDLHAWTITSGMNVLSAHVVLDEGADPPAVLDELCRCLSGDFDIDHSTFQLESSDRTRLEDARHT